MLLSLLNSFIARPSIASSGVRCRCQVQPPATSSICRCAARRGFLINCRHASEFASPGPCGQPFLLSTVEMYGFWPNCLNFPIGKTRPYVRARAGFQWGIAVRADYTDCAAGPLREWLSGPRWTPPLPLRERVYVRPRRDRFCRNPVRWAAVRRRSTHRRRHRWPLPDKP
jgi:hypothetical protein